MATKTTLHATNDRIDTGREEQERTITVTRTIGGEETTYEININGYCQNYEWRGATITACDTLIAAEKSSYDNMGRYQVGGDMWNVYAQVWTTN